MLFKKLKKAVRVTGAVFFEISVLPVRRCFRTWFYLLEGDVSKHGSTSSMLFQNMVLPVRGCFSRYLVEGVTFACVVYSRPSLVQEDST